MRRWLIQGRTGYFKKFEDENDQCVQIWRRNSLFTHIEYLCKNSLKNLKSWRINFVGRNF